jgi:SAM-dependent methyltransferase
MLLCGFALPPLFPAVNFHHISIYWRCQSPAEVIYDIIGADMFQDYQSILNMISRYSEKPALFEPGETHFWDDPHISKSMLESHLSPEADLASRRPETIDREVNNLVATCLKNGDRLLDLGCGPGLYAGRFAAKGISVTGIDISENSLNYAIAQARTYGLDIDYRLMNFLDIDFSNEFDTVLQAFGEVGTLSDERRGAFFACVRRALKPGGVFIFDVTTPALKGPLCRLNHWYVIEGGFWRPGRHLTMETRFDYPENDVYVDQYIVIDEERLAVYRIWNHSYTPDSLKPSLEKYGFDIVHVWNDLAGTPYKQGGDWLAVVAGKR